MSRRIIIFIADHELVTPQRRAAPRWVAVDDELPDVDLIQMVRDGNERAFDVLVTRHHSSIYTIAAKLLKCHHDGQEIASDTFIRARRGLDKFRGDSAFKTWLMRICFNLARNRYWFKMRRGYGRTHSLDCPISEDATATFGDVLPDDNAASPRTKTLGDEFDSVMQRAWNIIPPAHRKILDLRTRRHLDYEEIADELAINVGTVKSRLARSRVALLEAMTLICPDMNRANLVSWLTD